MAGSTAAGTLAGTSSNTLAGTSSKDIISEYPRLVLAFVSLQVLGWVVGLLSTAGILGPVGYQLLDALTPLDLAFCQAMFWGTLHHGSISYGRLAIVCRIAFLIDAFTFVFSNLTSFSSTGLESAVDAAIRNATSIAELLAQPTPWPMILHGARALVWFNVFVPFSAWIGVVTLAVGRIRLLEVTPPSKLQAFSTNLLRAFYLAICIELLLVLSTVIRTLSAETTEELILAERLNYAVKGLSFHLQMLPGWRVTIFNAAGVTVTQFRKGRAPLLTNLAVTFVLAHIAIVLFDLVVCLTAKSSADPIFTFHAWNAFVLFDSIVMMTAFVCAALSYGLRPGHLISIERAEERRRRRLGMSTDSERVVA